MDAWAKIESQRLRYLAKEQPKMRADKYRVVQAAVEAGLNGADIGKPKVLPSSLLEVTDTRGNSTRYHLQLPLHLSVS